MFCALLSTLLLASTTTDAFTAVVPLDKGNTGPAVLAPQQRRRRHRRYYGHLLHKGESSVSKSVIRLSANRVVEEKELIAMSSDREVEQVPAANAAADDDDEISTLTLLEHVNLNVPSHEHILPFYYKLLGCGMDPRKAANLRPAAPKKTLWANCGASQFHLPYGDEAQRIPGKIGLRYDSIAALRERLEKDETFRAHITEYKIDTDRITGKPCVRIADKYGNVFVCREGGNPVRDKALRQPVIYAGDTEEWGADGISQEYGLPDDDARTECRGMDYVEFDCPRGTADKIAQFYECVLDATTFVVQDGDDQVAVIAFGRVDASTGRADQSFTFRETDRPLPKYDGHHVAMYVGRNGADFEKAFQNAQTAGVVWINPRFSDKADTLDGARKWKQFRFKDIVDMKTGKTVFTLEHEMRSVEHDAWPGRKKTERVD